MSRSGYNDGCWDDDNNIHMINYRGAVKSALEGKRGQAFLQEMLEAMAAHPVKELIAGDLVGVGHVTCSHWGLFETTSACALGTVALKRGLDVSKLDPDDYASVAATFGISEAMAREIMFENDEAGYWRTLTDAARFDHVRRWIEATLYE
jgi:hypothetical protein